MSLIQRPLRYAHSEGHTNVCFSEDGKYIVTCGSEGDVRIWSGFDDEEPVDKCVGDKAYAVIVKGDKMYVGTSNNYVQSFTFPVPELDGVVTRFKAPVTSIDASSDGSILVCGSHEREKRKSTNMDMEIHVTEGGTLSSVLTDHKAPVLSVAVDPRGEYFASSSCDGSVKVWKLTNNIEVINSWDCVPKSNSVETSPTLCKTSWSPVSGCLLAIPDKTEVILYERGSWKKTMTLSVPSINENQFVSVCSFSPCGKYLAASSTDKQLFIWNVKNGKLEISLSTKEAPVCAIAWQPSKKDQYELVFCNNEGYLGYVEYKPNEQDDISSVEVEDINGDIQTRNGFDEIPGDDDDEFAISVEKIKADLGFNPDGSMMESRDRGRSRSKSRSRSRSVSRSRSRSPRLVAPKVDMQPPFQPSSTPTCLQYRFMNWSDIGIIEQTSTEDDQAISVKFHDSSFHYPFRIANELNYSMAALSADAAVFAGEKLDDKPSYLGCHPLQKGLEWFTELPEDEEATAVAAGIGWIAVATSMLTLRLFTIGGNQREVISLPGPIVCLAGYKNLLATIFHMSTGVGGHQWLGYSLLEIRPADICKFVIPFQSLPLTPGSILKWMGFSDCGALCTADSSGYVRLLSSTRGWFPICNTKKNVKGKSDHYFVLGVNESMQTIKVIFCKGSDYPPVIPVPYMTELPWKLPLCGSFEEKGGLEEVLWRSKLAFHCLDSGHLDNESDALIEAKKRIAIEKNRSVMKLFSIACLENHTTRALEVCQLSNSTLLMERAMQYAHLQNKTALAEQISELLTVKKTEEENGIVEPSSNMYSIPEADLNIHESVLSYVSSRFCNKRLQLFGHHDSASGVVSEMNYDNYSQDIFAETTEFGTDSCSSVPASEIQKKKLSPYAGRLSASKEDVSLIRKRALNPFKKLEEKSDSSKLLSTTPVANKTNMTLTGILSRKSKSDKVEKFNRSVDDVNSPKSDFPPFKEWFNTEKETFQRENPNLSIGQITKIALKKYKELKTSNILPSNVTLSASETEKDESIKENKSDLLSNDTNSPNEYQRKRKHGDEDTDTEDKLFPELKTQKKDESQSKEKLKSKEKSSEEIKLKKGVVKSANKLTGFFHKKHL